MSQGSPIDSTLSLNTRDKSHAAFDESPRHQATAAVRARGGIVHAIERLRSSGLSRDVHGARHFVANVAGQRVIGDPRVELTEMRVNAAESRDPILPAGAATFPSKKKAQDWAHRIESEMTAGHFVDRSAGQRTTLKELIELYLIDVTDKRPGEASRIAERSRLERFMRDEAELCAHAVANLTPDHFESYRDRRLSQPLGRRQDDRAGHGEARADPAQARHRLSQAAARPRCQPGQHRGCCASRRQ